jgi:cation diffusion facilitator CzcD-associated flavoprotein CzcO
VVGGGFGGVAALVMLRRAGYQDVTVFEKGERIGGVWSHNRYPGAACDIPSHLYEFSFAPNPRWSRRYAPQPEIQAYLERVVREHGVGDRIRTATEVQSAVWDAARRRWILQTGAGAFEADVLLCACGQLSIPQIPDIPGREDFAGPAFHTARWPAGLDLAGRRVAVIGTGASAIQVVPAIQPAVAQLDVYQRSPGWTIPRGDFAYGPRMQRLFERFPALQWLDRQATFLFHELGAAALTGQRWLLPVLKAVGRWNINRAISDPTLRERVTPGDEPGCKRIMLTDDFYPALSQDNVELVSDPIAGITASGVRTADGRERPVDVLVFATGFHTHAFMAPMEITGREGRRLSEVWAQVPRAYLGLSVPGFPNLFLIYGPNTNGGTGSVIYTIEAGIQHVIAAVREMESRAGHSIEVRPQTAEAFDRELRGRLAGTVWHSGCTNWYVDSHGNDPNQWPWTWSTYRRRTARISEAAYEVA